MTRNRLATLAWIGAVASVVWAASTVWDVTELGRLDFRIYYEAIGSTSLYDYRHPVVGLGFTYPPLAAVVLYPLVVVPVDVSERLWLVVTVASSAAFVAGVVHLLPRAERRWWVAPVSLAVGVWMIPVLLTARFGQVNALIAVLLLCDVALLQGRHRWAGVGTGLAAALKLTPALVIPYLFFGGRRRAGVVAALAAGIATLVAAVARPADSVRYWTDEVFATNRVGDVQSGYSHGLRRFVGWFTSDDLLQTVLWVLICAVLAAVVFGRVRRLLARNDCLTAFTLVLCLSYLVSPITWAHHLYFALPALILILSRATWPYLLVLPPALFVFRDPIELGEGSTYSAWRTLFLILVILVPGFLEGTRSLRDRSTRTPRNGQDCGCADGARTASSAGS